MIMIMRYALHIIILYGLKIRDVNLEFTVAEKSSFYQIAWNGKEQKNLMLAITTTGSLNVTDKNTIEGYELYSNKVKVFFYIKTDKSFTSDPGTRIVSF